MTRLCLSTILGAIVAAPLAAAPTVSHEGDVWTLSNDCLQVDIDARAGTYRVLDKRCGYLWQGPEGGPVQSATLAVPRAAQVPVVDGDLSDWGDAGAIVAITPQMLGDAKRVDNAADLSATLRVLWDPSGLYLGVEVSDDALVWPAADESQWWYKDSIEFWLNGSQYAIRAGQWGCNVWSSSGGAEDIRAAMKPGAGGYAIEAFIPLSRLGQEASRGLGGRLRFALGINDCDGEDGRQGQLYYPAGWQHSNTETFASATLVAEDGKPLAQAPAEPTRVLTPVDEQSPGRASFKVDLKSTAAPIPATLTFALDGDGPELLITATAENPAQSIGRFGVLHPLMLDRADGRILAATYCNGIGVPTEDLSWKGRQWATYSSLDMPWVGLTDGEIGYLLLWELPSSCDNGMARLEGGLCGGRELLAPGVYHDPIKGTFGAPRTVRYSFSAAGGHVALCKRYRRYAADNGILVTQKEKMRTRPAIARLAGAPDIWGRSDLAFCREARAAGMDRAIVNGPTAKADMQAIIDQGYLTSVYDNYEDMFEGDGGRYGDCKTETDAVVQADGSLKKAWLTKGDPPKQFMKRCTALFEKVARRWIPPELESHAYNARFLDVTTACGMIECYSDTHGLNRTEDRAARINLARYVGHELGLVLGGEHGRWWGVPYFDYWEGMQSGGFYSWPAGHVGLELPQSREEIGRNYLEWGLGEKNRYPLWELVFHDCVVSTWYWGDSTGHLQEVAPELGTKQDAFNVLYGTVPLYWVNKPYSYRWDEPETRARLLESYRNTCKLHEKIAFEEMLSHEFVTEDRAVQKTVFGDGTEVWVNFGQKPWTLQTGEESYNLPQFGFYAKGPQIELYRAQRAQQAADPGATPLVTCIRTEDYLSVQGNVPGLVETSDGLPLGLQRTADGGIKVLLAPGTTWATFDVDAVYPDAAEGQWLAVPADASGTPTKLLPVPAAEGGMLTLRAPLTDGATLLLLSPAAMVQRAEPGIAGEPGLAPARVAQGATARITVPLRNYGGKTAEGLEVSLYAGRPETGKKLATKSVTVPAGATSEVALEFDTSRYDGQVALSVLLDAADTVEEICEADNRGAVTLWVEPNLDLWESSVDVTVDPGELDRTGAIAGMAFAATVADPASIRVVVAKEGPLREHLAPCQYEPAEGRLLWRLPGTVPAGQTMPCRIHFDPADTGRHEAPVVTHWDSATESYEGPNYRVGFKEGYIRSVALRRGGELIEIIDHLGVSSQDTGWVDEVGEVRSFEVLSDGPVLTRVRVQKDLRGDHSYDKLYSFYPDHFEVTVLSPERFGTMSRSFYVAQCRYEDDKGNKAQIDGKGDAEGISGENSGPKWYATWTDDWALSGIPLTPHANVGYWDGGAMAGLGYNGSGENATVGYYLHIAAEGERLDGPKLAAGDYARAMAPVLVR